MLKKALMSSVSSTEGLMQLLQVMGKAQKEMGHYRCRKAIDVLNSLPPQHFETGWVLTTMGKAHFELSEYSQVMRSFFTYLFGLSYLLKNYSINKFYFILTDNL